VRSDFHKKRRENDIMKEEAKRMKIEEEEKEKQMQNALQVTYDYTEEEKACAIDKLTIAAKNYDKVFN